MVEVMEAVGEDAAVFGFRKINHGSCDLLRVGWNDFKKKNFVKSFKPTLNTSHDSLGFRLNIFLALSTYLLFLAYFI